MIKSTFEYFGKKYGSGHTAAEIESMKASNREIWAFEIIGGKVAMCPSVLSGECIQNIQTL